MTRNKTGNTAATFSACVGAAAVCLGSAASAHHSFAMFDPQKELTLRGVVKEFRWTNPHVFIELLASDGEGSAQADWSIEMTSPEHLARAGWKPRTLKAGDKVTLVIHPLRDGKRGGQYVSGTGIDGAPIGSDLKRVANSATRSGK